jgi:hypothetical protein
MLNKLKLLTRLGSFFLDGEIMLCENDPNAVPRRIEDLVYMKNESGALVAVLLMERPSPCRCHELKESQVSHEIPDEANSVPK